MSKWPSDCQCLPCVLRRALEGYQAAHDLTTSEELIDQLGTFVLRAISRLPEFEGQRIGMTLLKQLDDGTTERLH